MSDPIIKHTGGVTLVGGGEVGDGDLALALARAPLLVAVDAGAATALSEGQAPDAVFGDFDSLDPDIRARIPASRQFVISEQDSTDFDKALRHVSAPVVLGVGFLGGRVDHQLAVFNALVRRPEKRCILIGQTEVILHVPPQLDLDLRQGDVVSLFPMTRLGGRSKGLEWPIEGLDMGPDRRVGTSNRATGPVRLEMDRPGMLAIIPRRALDAAIVGLGEL